MTENTLPVACSSQNSPVPPDILTRVVAYLLAPFRISEWKKCCLEIRSLDCKKAREAGFKILCYYLLFSPIVAMPFYNSIIFHPFVAGDYFVEQIAGVKKQDVFFQSAERKMHAWYFSKPGAKNLVLISHGNAGNLTHRKALIQLLLESGASVFIYDYEGFGRSDGSPSVDNCCNDALAAYDCVSKQLKIPSEAIIVYGESIGTAFTCQLASKRTVSKIVLQSGFSSLLQIANEKVPLIALYPKELFMCNHLDSAAYLKGAHPPVLIIHGQKDEIIPAHNSDDLYRVASGSKFIVKLPEAGHNDVPEKMNFDGLSALSSFVQ
ncbi:MAG: alpha/beta hydrolase [Candidatus Obscuribacterales bacterium]|jgi:pimeloyl-ACP methyl ester carboxylesterase|nr:alpha/beta hydrolase [Candidatus Obscuribacterales bacterium]